MYLVLFLIGTIGFVAMVAMGALHGAGGHRGPASGSLARGHAPGALPHSHGPHAPHAGTHGAGHGRVAELAPVAKGHLAADSRPMGTMILTKVSPLDVFSVCLGAGSTGLLLQAQFPAVLLACLAACGGLLLDLGIVRPYMRYLMRFASNPSEGLEGSVSQEAEAVTSFDASGRGLIRLTLDGQNVQLLATLDDLEQEKGIRVRRGEKVLIVDVDATRNTCRVTRELAL